MYPHRGSSLLESVLWAGVGPGRHLLASGNLPLGCQLAIASEPVPDGDVADAYRDAPAMAKIPPRCSAIVDKIVGHPNTHSESNGRSCVLSCAMLCLHVP